MRKISLVSLISIAAMLLIACDAIENTSIDSAPTITDITAKLNSSINVSQNEAGGIADMFMRSYAGSDMPLTKSADTKRISSSATVREDGQDLMYVFNYEDGGFVIVGSTRNYYPILAYSDKGSFVLQDDMGPVAVWLDETKVSIKNSGSLDNDTKAQMQNLWARYDGTFVDPAQARLSSRRPQTRSTGEDACWNRIDSLTLEHGSEGWTYLPLSFVEDLFTDLGLSSVYSDLCYCASQNNSALNETVIGYRYPAVNQVGPLLQTEWHQDAPFNNLCPNHSPAGSEVIAAAQVMKFFAHPDTLMWDGNTIHWSDIPRSPDTVPNKIPQLIRRLGQLFNVNYGSPDPSMTLINLYLGLYSKGYVCDLDGHDELTVRDNVFTYHKPVIMVGWKNPNYGGANYVWVCDGVRQAVYNEIQFYTDNQPNGTGTFTQGMYTYSNPGLAGQPVGSPIYTYHMNWGQLNGLYNGWFANNYIYSSPIDYNNSRVNLYFNYIN